MGSGFPYSTRPEDVAKLLNILPGVDVPVGKLDAGYFSKMGFTSASGRHLFQILKMLGFINNKDTAAEIWKEYVVREQRGLTLASAIKNAYPELFEEMFCPYLEDDQVILDFIKKRVKASSRDTMLMVQTFRYLSESADFQDIMCEAGPQELPNLPPEGESLPEAKVNPNLQLNIQIHIDPATSDQKIEAIFKNLRKYLLGKES
jgi:hypothetical protein